MTYQIYSQQQLQLKSIARLKQIYSEIACTVEVIDKRCKDSWISAIANYQASKIQKLTPATPDNQALAQAELDHFIATQAQAIAPEPLTTVEISFYDHEVFAGNKLIASITHDDNDFVTQRWVVMVNGAEEHRADTWAKCYRYIQWHYQDGTLPVQEQLDPEANDTSGNEIMVQIFNECEKYGFDIFDDGIYQNDVKLGEVGFTGAWWVVRTGECQQLPCDSALEAVRWLSMIDVSTDGKSIFDEYFLEQPLEQLAGDKLQRLLERTELVTA
ncbi:hypothetical protein [Nostoc sp.]|uniref:hypothetical protein n=1 Tax=Nostoc sp. TaxID=1180 RepID=UPI00359398C5